MLAEGYRCVVDVYRKKHFASGFAGWLFLDATFVFLFSSVFAAAQGASTSSAKQLMRAVSKNEVYAQQHDQSLWCYRQVQKNNDGIEQRAFVETRFGDLHRLLGKNGHALTPSEANDEDARIDSVIKNPDRLRDAAEKERNDARQAEFFLQMLPNGFDYRELGREGGLVKLAFSPNPKFRPKKHEGQVFHHMRGTIWIDPTKKRIAKMEGVLSSEVKFGGGLFGHLDKGGTFMFEQNDMGRGHWELTRLRLNMNGKILFLKTINVDQNQANLDFESVPPNTSLAAAAEKLKREGFSPQPAVLDGDSERK